MKLTPKQIEAVVAWMNEWPQLNVSSIPLRFKEDFSQGEGARNPVYSGSLSPVTIWQPTPRLQFKSSLSQIREDAVIEVKTLQQLFIDGQGNEEWRNVEVVD